MRADLLVTTAQKPSPELVEQARIVAGELDATYTPRTAGGLAGMFARHPDASRAVVVQHDRLLLVSSDGWEFFYHPNLAFLRLGTILRGGRDLLLEAGEFSPGESVLDATLGYAAEAILCAHAVGESGEVHGIEAIPELGYVVRDGLARVTTDQKVLDAAMRRVQVVHLGPHLEFLRACPDKRYDVVCFDPFFDQAVGPQEKLGALRAFGAHGALLPEALEQARRVARRRVIVKAARHSPALDNLGITTRVAGRHSHVVYGIVDAPLA